jgi:hypothetical protein
MGGRIKEPPSFASEAEERAFWETHDSTDYLDLVAGAAGAVSEPQALDDVDLVKRTRRT